MVSITFDIIFMLQHYVWFPASAHQRIVVQAGKTSELASPSPSGSGQGSPFKVQIEHNGLETQRNEIETTIKDP